MCTDPGLAAASDSPASEADVAASCSAGSQLTTTTPPPVPRDCANAAHRALQSCDGEKHAAVSDGNCDPEITITSS
jgi:hypothetical protein